MSKRLYEATLLQLRGQALEALAQVEAKIASGGSVDEIIEFTNALTRCETAMTALQGYIGPHFAPPQAPPPPPATPKQTRPVTPEQSPTYRRSVEAQKLKKQLKKNTKKKDSND